MLSLSSLLVMLKYELCGTELFFVSYLFLIIVYVNLLIYCTLLFYF